MAEYVVNSAIYDVIVLRTTSGTAITGKVSGDFDTLEAYTLPSGATTAAVTLTEIGNGEYSATFTPSAAGTWVLHYIYDGDSIFLEVTGGPYVVQAAATLGASIAGAKYATLAELKARIGTALSANDDALTQCLEAASRAVDGFTGRRFYQDGATTRYYTADDSGYLEVDDLVSVTTLQTDGDGDRTYEDTWTSTDYDLEPYNAAVIAFPYTSIQTTPDGDYTFPAGIRKGVKIVGTWGWPSVPDPVTEATLLLAARLAKRQAAPFGVAELETGTLALPGVDPDVRQMLAPFRRITVGAI